MISIGFEGTLSSCATFFSSTGVCFFCALGLGLGFFTFACGGGSSTLVVTCFGSWGGQFSLIKFDKY